MHFRFDATVASAVFLVLLAAGPRAAWGQQPPENGAPARFNTDIVVTPERGDTTPTQVPASTVVLDAPTLQTLPVVVLGEALSYIPGFQVERGSFHAGRPLVSARGFFGGGEADYVLLLIDGVPSVDAESGLADWSVVPLSSIRRIEASRGPGASMYGDAAVGGVIQILTDRRSARRADDDHGRHLRYSDLRWDVPAAVREHRRRVLGNPEADVRCVGPLRSRVRRRQRGR